MLRAHLVRQAEQRDVRAAGGLGGRHVLEPQVAASGERRVNRAQRLADMIDRHHAGELDVGVNQQAADHLGPAVAGAADDDGLEALHRALLCSIALRLVDADDAAVRSKPWPAGLPHRGRRSSPMSTTGAIPSSPKIGQTPPASAPTLGQKDFEGVQPAVRPSAPASIKTATSDFMARMMGGSGGGCQDRTRLAPTCGFSAPLRLIRGLVFGEKPALALTRPDRPSTLRVSCIAPG